WPMRCRAAARRRWPQRVSSITHSRRRSKPSNTLARTVSGCAHNAGAGQLSHQPHSEVTRLENLWSGDFGDAYIERNRNVSDARGPFWTQLLDQFPVQRALEIGCNMGPNLRWLRQRVSDVYGVDVNAAALAELRRTMPDVNAVRSPGRDLPFRD